MNYIGISILSLWTGFDLLLVLLTFRLLISGPNIFSEISTSYILMGKLAMELIINNVSNFCTVGAPMMWYNMRTCFTLSNLLVVYFIRFCFTVTTKLLEPDLRFGDKK